ncbi:flagellar type III secretion system pore protein FliP [Pseudoxanthobacter soli]|nr:flagellar biosynthetic protein FliP [Pseudoxanthobacter soli]
MLPVMIADAHAQSNLLADLLPAGNASMSGRIVQLFALLTVLSIAPGLLIMVTSFTRFAVALSFLRSGLGLQSTPANLVLISLSLFMTFFVMAPTFDRAWRDGIVPLTQNAITEEQAYDRITAPFREFMLAEVRPKDLQLFTDLAANARDQGRRAAGAANGADGDAAAETSGSAQEEDRDTRASAPAAPSFIPTEAVDLRVLIPAFMISELRRGFEIGFLIALPFLVIDMVVATLIMSMGMMMLPPSIISLPFKVLFFVLIDGWNMLIGGLVRSYY